VWSGTPCCHVPDINDLLANTLGAPIGSGIFRLALLVPALGRSARAASWPMPPQNDSDIQAARVDL
jgi:hypothetical protein